MSKQSSNRLNLDHSFTRRKFLGTTALSSAALLSGGITSLLRQSASASHGGFDFVEQSILELQDAMASGQLTSRDLTHGYIGRIQSLNPLLNSVIELNPNAIAIASHSITNGAGDKFVVRFMAFRFSSRTTSRPMTKCRQQLAHSRFTATTCRATR